MKATITAKERLPLENIAVDVDGRTKRAFQSSFAVESKLTTALTLVGVLLTVLTACSHKDKTVGVSDDDPEMRAATSKARDTLPQFWHTFEKHDHGETGFSL